MERNGIIFLFALSTVTLIYFSMPISAQDRLSIQGENFMLHGERVFMSGMNLGWHDYGNDFGNDQYECCSGPILEDYLRRIHEAGGNSVRIFLHGDGAHTPLFNETGYAVGTDATGSMASDLSKFLDVAEQYDILVFIALWNGAARPTSQAVDLMFDEQKLLMYHANVVTPLVRSLENKVALGGWDIISQPEGLVHVGQEDANPCFDTTLLEGTGAGWTNTYVPMANILRFINQISAAIYHGYSASLVTVTSFSEITRTNEFGYYNYYTYECLVTGGFSYGTLDYTQISTYATEGSYNTHSPIYEHANNLGAPKPVVVSQISQATGDGRPVSTMFNQLYHDNYCGVWTWQANEEGQGSDSFETQLSGLERVASINNQDLCGRVNFSLQPEK